MPPTLLGDNLADGFFTQIMMHSYGCIGHHDRHAITEVGDILRINLFVSPFYCFISSVHTFFRLEVRGERLEAWRICKQQLQQLDSYLSLRFERFFQQHSARVRQLKRTELAGELEALNASALPKNRRFSGAPDARIVRQSRSFDRKGDKNSLERQAESIRP